MKGIEMLNHNNHRYATHDEVIAAVKTYSARYISNMPLVATKLFSESITTWYCVFRDDVSEVQVTLEILPSQSTPGYYATVHQLWHVGRAMYSDAKLIGYPSNLQKLIDRFPNRRMTHVDNEGKPSIFGYAALDDELRVIAFAQHPMDEDADEEYWFNDYLPYDRVVDDPDIMEAINDEMHDYHMVNIDQLDRY